MEGLARFWSNNDAGLLFAACGQGDVDQFEASLDKLLVEHSLLEILSWEPDDMDLIHKASREGRVNILESLLKRACEAGIEKEFSTMLERRKEVRHCLLISVFWIRTKS